MRATELARRSLTSLDVPRHLRFHLERQLSSEVIEDCECLLGEVTHYLRTQIVRQSLFTESRCIGRLESIDALRKVGLAHAWNGVFLTAEATVAITTDSDFRFCCVLVAYGGEVPIFVE
jgi:hypothetical protein